VLILVFKESDGTCVMKYKKSKKKIKGKLHRHAHMLIKECASRRSAIYVVYVAIILE
jgi:hypothetical protein